MGAVMATTWKTTLIALVFTCVMAFSSQPASVEESLNWMVANFPYIGLAEGPRKDTGIGDLIARMVARHLPEIDQGTGVSKDSAIILSGPQGSRFTFGLRVGEAPADRDRAGLSARGAPDNLPGWQNSAGFLEYLRPQARNICL